MSKLLYSFVLFFKKSRHLSAVSCRLTKLTGKSKYPIHPKHLVEIEKQWYLSGLDKNDIVLDLGCGNGYQTIKAAQKCKKIIGLDKNTQNLNIAKKMSKDKKINNIQFKELDLEKKLIFKNNYFDKVLILDILEHLNNRGQFLSEIKRVLKPGGIGFLSLPNKDTSWKKIQKKTGINYYTDPDHKIEYSLNQIKKILNKAGFKILSIKPVVLDTPLSGFIDFIGGFSLNLYKVLSRWKINKVKNKISESIGFRITARK